MKQKRFILSGIVACLLSSCGGGGSGGSVDPATLNTPPSPLLASGTVDLSLRRTTGGDWNELSSWQSVPEAFGEKIPTLTEWTTSSSTFYAALDSAGTVLAPLIIQDSSKVSSLYPYRFSVLDMNNSYVQIKAPTSSAVTMLKSNSTIQASQAYSSKYFYLETASIFQGKFSFSDNGDLSQIKLTAPSKFTSPIPNRDNGYGLTVINGDFTGDLNIDQLNIVFGTGTIIGDVTNSNGTIFADKDHILNITGNYTQNGGELYLKPTPNNTPLLKISGTATLSSGKVTLDLSGITPSTTDSYILMEATNVNSSINKAYTTDTRGLYPSLRASGSKLVLEFLASAPNDGVTIIGTSSSLWQAPNIVHSFASSKKVSLFKSQNLNAQSFESEWGSTFKNPGEILTESLTFSRVSFLNSDHVVSKVNKLAISETLTLFENPGFKFSPEYKFTIADTTEVYPYLHEWNAHTHFSFSKNFDLKTSLAFKKSDDWTETLWSASFKNSVLPFIDSLKFQSSFIKYKKLSSFRHFLELEFKS